MVVMQLSSPLTSPSSSLSSSRRRRRRRRRLAVMLQHHGRVGASVASSSRAGRQQATSPAPYDAERRRQTRVHDHQYQQRPD